MAIELPARGSRRRTQTLRHQLRAAIVGGRLAPGLRLPSTRSLSAALGMSRNAVIAAYAALLDEGHLEAMRGSGHRVASERRQQPRSGADSTRIRARQGGLARLAREHRSAAPPLPDPDATRPTFDFRLGVPDLRFLADANWRRIAARTLRTLGRTTRGYGSPLGEPGLREAIARHASFARAVSCEAADVVVTSGAQQAFDLLARVLVTTGRTVVAFEAPGYPPARHAFEAHGARVVAVPVDRDGLVVSQLPARAAVVYVTPSHQFPMGVVMSRQRRLELLDFARKHGAVIIEDDYDGEFRFDGRPLDALQTLDRSGCVFYVGTFSKTLFPSLRLGYVIAPSWTVAAIAHAKGLADGHCSLPQQLTLQAYMDEGHLARHVRRMNGLYARRRATLLDGLKRDFGGWLRAAPSGAGLHIAALAAPGVNVERIAAQARAVDVGLYPAREYGDAAPPALLFGYGAIDAGGIDEGLRRLHAILRSSCG